MKAGQTYRWYESVRAEAIEYLRNHPDAPLSEVCARFQIQDAMLRRWRRAAGLTVRRRGGSAKGRKLPGRRQ